MSNVVDIRPPNQREVAQKTVEELMGCSFKVCLIVGRTQEGRLRWNFVGNSSVDEALGILEMLKASLISDVQRSK